MNGSLLKHKSSTRVWKYKRSLTNAFVWDETLLSMRLPSNDIAFCVFLLGFIALFTDQSSTEKRSNKVYYSVLHFKNYFITMFSAISF